MLLEPAAANQTDFSRSPFIGTRPFSREDAIFFFGREQEAAQLASIIFAGTMAVLYGDSGVGKSSMLNARLPDVLEEIEPDVTRFYMGFSNPRIGGVVLADLDDEDACGEIESVTLLVQLLYILCPIALIR